MNSRPWQTDSMLAGLTRGLWTDTQVARRARERRRGQHRGSRDPKHGEYHVALPRRECEEQQGDSLSR